VQDGKVLLVKRGIEPFKGWWDIPGGFLEAGEHPRDGMLREVHEETGLSVCARELLGVYMDKYATADGRTIYTLNHYYIVEPTGGTLRAADDAVELRWFALDALPEQVAFEHAGVVLEELQKKVTSGG
jgi:8-oxo-dGTP diphosphatase